MGEKKQALISWLDDIFGSSSNKRASASAFHFSNKNAFSFPNIETKWQQRKLLLMERLLFFLFLFFLYFRGKTEWRAELEGTRAGGECHWRLNLERWHKADSHEWVPLLSFQGQRFSPAYFLFPQHFMKNIWLFSDKSSLGCSGCSLSTIYTVQINNPFSILVG